MFSFRDIMLSGKTSSVKYRGKNMSPAKSRMKVTTSTFISNLIAKLSTVPKLKQLLNWITGTIDFIFKWEITPRPRYPLP
jgi:hypothetical protein